MAASITDLLDRVTDSTTGRPVISALGGSGKAIAAPSVTITDATNWTTTTAIHFSIYNTQVVGGITVKDPTTQTDWKGTLSGTTISNLTLTGGTDRTYVAGAIIELTPTARFQKDLYDLLALLFNQDGSLKSAPVQTALGLGASSLNGWNALGFTPSTVTALGNRSYSLLFTGQDLTGTLSPGTRLRTTRTVPAPTQCTSLNGTTQFYSRVSGSVAAMTFVDDFTLSAWVKMTSYATAGSRIASRSNGANGWEFYINANGQAGMIGYNAGAGNQSQVFSLQSVPLNKWVHITVQLDMSTFTATTTTSYVMLDGLDVPAGVTRGGTNPIAIVQAGNLEIGSTNGGTLPFPGKIAQVAIYNAKVTQATILTSISQGLVGTETSLISAYNFNNSINDLNTTNANNLTANGSAVATSTDSPFGGQAGGGISSTLDYGIVQSSVFSTNTTVIVQVPEGCTIPTSGGVSSVVYSSNKEPYAFPAQRGKWVVRTVIRATEQISIAGITNWSFGTSINCLNIPAGEWKYGFQGAFFQQSTVAGTRDAMIALASSPPSGGVAPTPALRPYSSSSAIVGMASGKAEDDVSLAAATVFRFYSYLNSATGTETWTINGNQLECTIFAENALL